MKKFQVRFKDKIYIVKAKDETSAVKKVIAFNDNDTDNYMLLSRLKSDCDYFLGAGNGNEKHLWAKNVEEHIKTMKELFNKVSVKPDWITKKDIENYERKMLAKRK